jgi:hypothetical protein
MQQRKMNISHKKEEGPYKSGTRKMWPFNAGYCLIEVTAWEDSFIFSNV